MLEVERVEVGDELALPLPDDLLARWGFTVDDQIYLTETANGFILSPKPPELGPPAAP